MAVLVRLPHLPPRFALLQAATRGNFTARLCHSCEPNCKRVPMVVGGRLTLGVWTVRPIAAGEELTLDWGAETESERDRQCAVCLCGSATCRGSFLRLRRPEAANPLQQVWLRR